jgi:hypothetical protein
MSVFEVLACKSNVNREELLKAFFSVTGETEQEEKKLKSNLGKWRKVTKEAFLLLKVTHPEIAELFDKNHPMKNVRQFAA